MGLDIYFHKTRRQEIGYFRKVNFLVRFFEEFREKKVDNLNPIRVDIEDAVDLLDRCNAVLEDHSKAEKLLPTTSGFFFGSTEYDDDYFDCVRHVKDYVENTLLKEFEDLREGESIEFEIWY